MPSFGPGLNIDLRRMAGLSDLPYDQLLRCANWHIWEESLQAATNVLINLRISSA